MRHTGNFNLEWGYLAPSPSFLRSVRLAVVAATIAATASAAVVFALVRQPNAEASVAARTLLPSGETASMPPPSAIAGTRTQSDHASTPNAEHAVAGSRQSATVIAATGANPAAASGLTIASAPQRIAATEASKAAAGAPAARTAPAIAAAAAEATTPKTPKRKAREAKGTTAEASRLRIASAQHGVKAVALPAAHNVVRTSVVADDDNSVRDDDSLLAKTMGVTDHVVAATQRAVSTIGVIPSWIGSIGDRLGD
jgi:hypothetical protein